jgi:hypothetical protein
MFQSARCHTPRHCDLRQHRTDSTIYRTNYALHDLHPPPQLRCTVSILTNYWNLSLSDYTLMEVMKEEPIRVTIRGLRRTFYPPLHHPPHDNSPPEKRLQINWVYPFEHLRQEFRGIRVPRYKLVIQCLIQ